MRAALLFVAALLVADPAAADEDAIKLKDAPGRDVVEANCIACHSLDYIQMNSPFLDRKKWEAIVAKMVGKFGAPIEETDTGAIVDYLTSNYGVAD